MRHSRTAAARSAKLTRNSLPMPANVGWSGGKTGQVQQHATKATLGKFEFHGSSLRKMAIRASFSFRVSSRSHSRSLVAR